MRAYNMYASKATSCRLLDLPLELFQKCMPERSSLPQALALCRQMFDTHCGSLRMCLDVGENADAKGVALLRMLQSFPSLQKLGIHFRQGVRDEVLESIIAPPLATVPHVLACIVDMIISSTAKDLSAQAHLSSLIPQCVAVGCPQLARLTLRKLRIVQRQPQPQQPCILPNLQQLVLDQCSIDIPRDLVEQQLQAAHHLHHVKLVTDDMDAVNTFSNHVSEVEYTGPEWDKRKLAWALATVKQPCQKLHKLTANQLRLHDGMIEEFLAAAPNLEQLSVYGAHIIHDWGKDLRYKWKQLTFCNVPDYTSLACLPASSELSMQLFYSGIQDIQVQSPRWAVDPEECPEELQPGVLGWSKHSPHIQVYQQQHWGDDWELQLAARAHTIAQQAGGFRNAGKNIKAKATFSVWEHESQVVQQILKHVICMFSNLEHIVLKGNIHVSTEMLLHVGQSPTCKRVELIDDTVQWPEGVYATCKFQDSVWENIVPLLPHVSDLVLCCAQVTAQNVKALCAAATHAMTVRVMRQAWCLDNEANCGLVKVELLDP